MALVIDATPGGANSNSYISLADATAYFEGRLHSSAWDDATEANQKAALVQSTRMLDQYFAWQGTKASTTQALDWPRTGVVDCAGESVDSTTIPKQIEDATCEQAMALLAFDITKTPQALQLGVKKGEVKNGVMAEMGMEFQPSAIDKMVSVSIGCLGTQTYGSNNGMLTRY